MSTQADCHDTGAPDAGPPRRQRHAYPRCGSSAPASDLAQNLREVIADLTDRFAERTDIEEALAGITSAAVHLIPGVASADVLIITDADDYRSLAATSPLATDMAQLQRRHRQGPGLDAADGETMVLSNDLRAERRWPTYAAAAVKAGVLAALSFQLHTPQQQDPTRRAVLTLVSHLPDTFNREAQTVAAILAAHAATASIAHDRGAQFQSALATRDAIGQAKGMIMERFDVDAAHAFGLMKKLSQDSNIRVVDVAAQIVARGAGR
jgi:ANTAR domain-containing protein/GAF domain-containing protein